MYREMWDFWKTSRYLENQWSPWTLVLDQKSFIAGKISTTGGYFHTSMFRQLFLCFSVNRLLHLCLSLDPFSALQWFTSHFLKKPSVMISHFLKVSKKYQVFPFTMYVDVEILTFWYNVPVPSSSPDHNKATLFYINKSKFRKNKNFSKKTWVSHSTDLLLMRMERRWRHCLRGQQLATGWWERHTQYDRLWVHEYDRLWVHDMIFKHDF
jgi:hypothetical protein